MIRRLVTSFALVAGAFAFQLGTAAPARAGNTSCVDAIDDAYNTPFNTPISITDTQVLSNDVVSSDCSIYKHSDLYINHSTDLIPPSHGTLDRVGDTWTYTPDDGFVGTDSFKYKACLHQPEIVIEGEGGEGDDCEQCDWATVSIDPQGQVTTTTATVLDTVITNSSSSTTAATVLAAQLAATGADTSATLPIAGLLTGSGAIFIAGAAIARRRLRGKYKKA